MHTPALPTFLAMVVVAAIAASALELHGNDRPPICPTLGCTTSRTFAVTVALPTSPPAVLWASNTSKTTPFQGLGCASNGGIVACSTPTSLLLANASTGVELMKRPVKNTESLVPLIAYDGTTVSCDSESLFLIGATGGGGWEDHATDASVWQFCRSPSLVSQIILLFPGAGVLYSDDDEGTPIAAIRFGSDGESLLSSPATDASGLRAYFATVTAPGASRQLRLWALSKSNSIVSRLSLPWNFTVSATFQQESIVGPSVAALNTTQTIVLGAGCTLYGVVDGHASAYAAWSTAVCEGGRITALAVDGNTVWVATSGSASLIPVSVESGKTAPPLTVGGPGFVITSYVGVSTGALLVGGSTPSHPANLLAVSRSGAAIWSAALPTSSTLTGQVLVPSPSNWLDPSSSPLLTVQAANGAVFVLGW